jgi:hypothetical protein
LKYLNFSNCELKKLSFRAYSNISASFDFFTKILTDLSLELKNI